VIERSWHQGIEWQQTVSRFDLGLALGLAVGLWFEAGGLRPCRSAIYNLPLAIRDGHVSFHGLVAVTYRVADFGVIKL